MARNLVWKDLTALPRYQNQKLYLDNVLRLVYNSGLVSHSLLSILAPSSGFCTAVEPIDSDQYPFLLGQIYHPVDSVSARMVFLAPGLMDTHPGFASVLTYLATLAGNWGALQVLAEVSLHSLEEEILHQAGFRPYAEQQIWKLPRHIYFESGKKNWIPILRSDALAVVSAYQRILPGQIQRVEPPPSFPNLQGMISWIDGKVAGFAEIHFGPHGILIDLFTDPALPDLDEYLGALLFQLPYRNTREVYLRVRSYQEQISSALERVGAEPGSRQKAVVKKLAVHYNAKQTFRVQGFEKQPDVTTPISNTDINN